MPDNDPIPPPPTGPEPDPRARTALVVDLAALNVNLHRAVGLDPEATQGFRLTVMGGQFPQLEVYPLPPLGDGGGLADPWSDPLAEAFVGVVHVLLPGGHDVPLATVPGNVMPPDLVPPDQRDDAAAARLLRTLADAINGAALTPDLRDWATSAAHTLAGRFEDRVFAAADATIRARVVADTPKGDDQ